jgi:hypothetical protein
MNRRELLGAVGLGATGLVGFVGRRAGGVMGQDTRSTQPTETTTRQTTTAGEEFTGIDSEAEQPFATISVGSREVVENPENNRPHTVRVWNDSDSSRTIGLRLVRDGDDESALVDQAVEFPPDGYLILDLLEPADYSLAVRPDEETGAEGGETIEIPRSQFDCNDSQTDVAVTADGAVKSVTITTEIGCPPEVTALAFVAVGGSCGSADEASVSFAEESVEVSGFIRTPNPCYGAELAGVSFPSVDTLRVTIGTTEPMVDVCAQCIGTIDYEADLTFRDRVPGTVEVVHQRDDETETVATVTRGATTTVPATTTEQQ